MEPARLSGVLLFASGTTPTNDFYQSCVARDSIAQGLHEPRAYLAEPSYRAIDGAITAWLTLRWARLSTYLLTRHRLLQCLLAGREDRMAAVSSFHRDAEQENERRWVRLLARHSELGQERPAG